MRTQIDRRSLVRWAAGAGLVGSLATTTNAATGQKAKKDQSGSRALPKKIVVVQQDEVGPESCVACSIYHAFVNGSRKRQKFAKKLKGASHIKKIQSLVAEWAELDSPQYSKTQKVYTESRGIAPQDIPFLLSDWWKKVGEEPMTRTIPSRNSDESDEAFVRRIHGLLTASESPPLISLRSFAGQWSKERERTLWNFQTGHQVVALGVDPLPERGKISGFGIQLLDSVAGDLIPAFVYLDRRSFSATTDFTINEDDGSLNWEWKGNSPFLAVSTPDLLLGGQSLDPGTRLVVTLNQICA